MPDSSLSFPPAIPGLFRVSVALLGLFLGACSADDPSDPGIDDPVNPDENTAEAGQLRSLDQIIESGNLRVIVRRSPYDDGLPRRASPMHHERALAGDLAQELGVTAVLVPVEQRGDMIPALLAGLGDVVMGNLSVTDERAAQVSFSAPVATTREIIVARDDDSIVATSELAGRTLAVQRSAAWWDTAQSLAGRVDGLVVEAVDESLDSHDVIDGVASGRFDLTIADENFLDATLGWRDDVQGTITVGPPRLIAWAVHPQAESLRRAVDLFLLRARISNAAVAASDLSEIRERGQLRVLTRNNAATYYIWRGELFGFEFELTRGLADALGVRADMVVAPSRDILFEWLRSGRGDLIAANLTASPARAREEGIVFSEPYYYVRETVVSRADEPPLASVEDLAGREVAVRRSSSYWNTLEALREDGGISLELVAVDETMETEHIIDAVARGEFDLTVADGHIAGLEMAWRDDIRADLEITDPVPFGWAMRAEDTDLHEAVNEYIRNNYRGLFFNIVVEKYFEAEREPGSGGAAELQQAGGISPFDHLAMEYGGQYGFDWRLIVSQMYQESRFDPEARSFADAGGLLQVLPSTAAELGFDAADITDPETGVHAGVRYLDWTRDRFDELVPPSQQNWFALAAYNVGQGHVRDARQLARNQGLDPDLWFDNVETAMLLKEQPEFYRETRFGYARGREPVDYVRAVRRRYEAYLTLPLQ